MYDLIVFAISEDSSFEVKCGSEEQSDGNVIIT